MAKFERSIKLQKGLHNINVFCPLVNMGRDIHILIRAMTEFHFQILDVLTDAIKDYSNDGFCFFISFFVKLVIFPYTANVPTAH